MKNPKKLILIYAVLMLVFGLYSPVINSLIYFYESDTIKEIFEKPFFSYLGFISSILPRFPDHQTQLLLNIIGNGINTNSDGSRHNMSNTITAMKIFSPFLICWVVLFVGTIQYFKNNKTKLLLFIFAVSFLGHSFSFLYPLSNLVFDVKTILYGFYSSIDPENVNLILFHVLLNVIHLFILFKIISFLRKSESLKVEDNSLIETSKGRRFWGRCIEIILIVFYGWQFSIFYMAMVKTLWIESQSLSDYSQLGLYNAFATLCYYLIFESIFQTTPAKILMGSRVVNRDAEKPSFLVILGRTLCRFIPFESFLFLIGYRLHDTFSNTNVYDTEEQ